MQKIELLRKLKKMEGEVRWAVNQVFALRDVQLMIDIFENMTDEEYEDLKTRHFG